MKDCRTKNIRTATNETITTKNGSIVRFEDILEGIRKNVEIYGFNGGRDLSDEDLEDIFQTAATKAWRSVTGFDPDKCHSYPQAYGYKIALLAERDAYKKVMTYRANFTSLSAVKSKNKDGKEYDLLDVPTLKGKYKSSEFDARRCTQSAESDIVSRENMSYIMDAMDSLNERYRTVIRLKAEGYKPREIAEMTGETPEVVTTTLFRARQAMKKALGPEFLSEFGLCA
jgi:RNA polymerase sigma factor (sigma-70 family)